MVVRSRQSQATVVGREKREHSIGKATAVENPSASEHNTCYRTLSVSSLPNAVSAIHNH